MSKNHIELQQDTKIGLHLGCGTVYLTSKDKNFQWVNIDDNKCCTEIKYAKEADAKSNITTLDKYYKHSFNTVFNKEKRVIVDINDDIIDFYILRNRGLTDGIIDKIVCIQVLEHICNYKVLHALKIWNKLLKDNGSLLLSVPDFKGTIDYIKDNYNTNNREKIDFGMRLLLGSNRNHHVTWLDREKLFCLLKKAGFLNVKESTIIQHEYPAIVVECFK